MPVHKMQCMLFNFGFVKEVSAIFPDTMSALPTVTGPSNMAVLSRASCDVELVGACMYCCKTKLAMPRFGSHVSSPELNNTRGDRCRELRDGTTTYDTTGRRVRWDVTNPRRKCRPRNGLRHLRRLMCARRGKHSRRFSRAGSTAFGRHHLPAAEQEPAMLAYSM